MLVRLLVRSPAPRILPPPTRRLPNLRTNVAPAEKGGAGAGDSTTSGGASAASDVVSACSSSKRSENVGSSGPAVRGRSCPFTLLVLLTLTRSCPCSLVPVPPPELPPPPNILAKPRGTP